MVAGAGYALFLAFQIRPRKVAHGCLNAARRKRNSHARPLTNFQIPSRACRAAKQNAPIQRELRYDVRSPKVNGSALWDAPLPCRERLERRSASTHQTPDPREAYIRRPPRTPRYRRMVRKDQQRQLRISDRTASPAPKSTLRYPDRWTTRRGGSLDPLADICSTIRNLPDESTASGARKPTDDQTVIRAQAVSAPGRRIDRIGVPGPGRSDIHHEQHCCGRRGTSPPGRSPSAPARKSKPKCQTRGLPGTGLSASGRGVRGETRDCRRGKHVPVKISPVRRDRCRNVLRHSPGVDDVRLIAPVAESIA